MKKAFLRRMSLLAAGVLLATGLSGFSAEPGLSVFEDFSGFTTENSAPQGMSFGNLYAGINSFSPARGLAGKDRSDTSLLIHSAQAEYPEDWQTSMGKWVYNPNMNMNIGLSGLEECQKIHLSFQLLDKDYHVQKSMGMKISSQKPNGDGTWTKEATHWANGMEYMLSMGVVNGNPEIRLFGSAEKAYRYNLGEWYRFDLVLNRETNDEGYAVMDVYINGEPVWTAFPFKAGVSGTGSILTGLEALWFQYSTAVLSGTQNTRCSAAMGVDGIRASVVDAQTVPQFTKLAGTVYTDFSYIVSDANYSSYYANGTSMAPISKDVWYGNFEPPESGRLPSVIVGGTEEKTGTIRFTAQNGVFGRPAEDQSLYLNNPKQFFPVSDDGPFRWFSEAYVGIQDTAATGLAAGDQFRCSISVAADENSHSGPMNTETRFIDSDGKAVTGASILSISNGLVPSVFGTVLDFPWSLKNGISLTLSVRWEKRTKRQIPQGYL